MSERARYRKKHSSFVTAVRLDLDTSGFKYKKWDAEQRCKAGDWVVDNDGDVYTVDADVFAATYHEQSPGVYLKTQTIWAEVARDDGSVQTLEGATHYKAGDYLVSNNEDGTDAYAIGADKFLTMYEPATEPGTIDP